MNPAHRQASFRLRMDWGVDGAEAIAEGADVAVVVDVLSFTTTVTVALEAGITVWPYRWADAGAAAYAAERGAALAVGRSQARPGSGAVSLSPASVRAATDITHLVLPSPNGSTIAAHLASATTTVVAASLLNAEAVVQWIDSRLAEEEGVVAVIAAGERWSGGGLRPALEDLWGAGAVISRLRRAGRASASPEALAAAAAYDGVASQLGRLLATTASGSELIAAGFPADVEIAAEENSSQMVPQLVGNAFVPAGERGPRSAG
jgi:2-phosphosulfolactate phosphatase